MKVREATSNDPWGAPSTLMGEIADLTYNVVAFTEIMQIVWKRYVRHCPWIFFFMKAYTPSSVQYVVLMLTLVAFHRLNDNGKNWRHVYKALVLLEYLIKVGSERVASQCKENIFNIQTLKGKNELAVTSSFHSPWGRFPTRFCSGYCVLTIVSFFYNSHDIYEEMVILVK